MFHNAPVTGPCFPGSASTYLRVPAWPQPKEPPAAGPPRDARVSRSWTGDLSRFDFGRALDLETTVLPAYLLAGPLMEPEPQQVPCTAAQLAARRVRRS